MEERNGEMKDTNEIRSKRHLSGTSSLGDGQASEFLEDISPVPSPDYDAPSPEADELELQLPDDTHALNSNAVLSNTSSGTPTPITQSPQPSYSQQQNALGLQGSGGGDLSSRLDLMTSSSLKVNLSLKYHLKSNFARFYLFSISSVS